MRNKVLRKKSEEGRNKLRNFLILICIFIFCIAFILYLCQLYKITEKEKNKIPVISGALSEIYREDLEHYVLDNPTTIIYMCVADNDVCRNFERDFKKLLKKKEYSDQIVYLNLTDLDQDEFIRSFNEVYHYKISLTERYPAFVLFEDGKVKNILQGNEKKDLTIVKVKQFLELNTIGE